MLSNLWTKQCQKCFALCSIKTSAFALRRFFQVPPPCSFCQDTHFFWLVLLPNYLTDKKEFDLCLGISHYLACRSNLAKHFTVCYLWPLTVRSQLLDLHSHNENHWLMVESKLSRSVMIESNLSRSECVVLQTPQHLLKHPSSAGAKGKKSQNRSFLRVWWWVCVRSVTKSGLFLIYTT